MIIKIFKLHPPCHASRFPFPAGIDSLAGIKKGKKKNGDIACEISSQLLEISIQRIRLIVVQKLPHYSFVSHLFSNFFFFISSRPSFQLACRGDRKKKKKEKLSGYCEKSWRQSRTKVFAQFSPPRRAIGQNRREGKLLLFFSWSDSSDRMRWIFHSTGNGRRGEERKEARDRSEFRSRCTEGNKLRPLGDFSDPSRTRRCLSWWGIKMDCIFYENLLLRRGAQRLS